MAIAGNIERQMMGCYNKTCGLSNLPIYSGDEVYVFILEENSNKTDRCYTTAFWLPSLLPFYSKYNDYGDGEESSGAGLPILMNHLKHVIVEVSSDANDKSAEVKRESFDVDKFFESVHEGRLAVNHWANESSQIDYVMFRKDVVDYILEHNVVQEYVGPDKGNTGWNSAYIDTTFSDILNDVDWFLDRMYTRLKEDKFFFHERLIDMSSGTHIDRHLGRHGLREYQQSVTFRLSEIANLARRDMHRDDIKAVLIDFLKGSYINYFMDRTRRHWAPGCHEGSQSGINPEYEVLIAATENSIKTIEKEFGEDEDEYED